MKQKILSNPLSINDVTKYVEENIGKFHESRLKSLEIVEITKILKRKNPYLYKVKNLGVAHDVVKEILNAHISSSEETKFGDWLEEMAIWINKRVYGGIKSSAPGIDLEFENGDIRYIVSIKSGPNWANSSQIKKMISDFDMAKRTINTSNKKQNVIAVNGCCYGRGSTELQKGGYYKYCGQSFWTFISGIENLYLDIIEPLGINAKAKNENYIEQYNAVLNRLTQQFTEEFCNKKGILDWHKIVRMTSESRK